MRRRLAQITVLAFLGLLAWAAPAAWAERPNIVVVQTDDQTADSFADRYMPRTVRLMEAGGTTFSTYLATTPSCCPSRASLFTGQYAHNTGVLSNERGREALRQPASTLPSWLQAAGYRTAHVGKWLNGHSAPIDPAPGWDHWITQLSYEYFGYRLTFGGQVIRFAASERDYLTRELTRQATGLIERFSRRRQPFYLQLDQFAPHQSKTGTVSCPEAAVPDPRDAHRFRGKPLPTPPSFNEEDVSDKRQFMRRRDEVSGRLLERTRTFHRCRLASLRGVDRSVEAVWETLKKTGEARNTILVFLSDNGFFAGEHRLDDGKTLPYQEATVVPLGIRLPPRLRENGTPQEVDLPTANIDIAPTLLDFAKEEPCIRGKCRRMDGRSLRPLLRGSLGGWPEDRGVLLEYGGGKEFEQARGTCRYEGVRLADSVLVRYNPGGVCGWPDGELELYDLAADPFELENRAGDPPFAARQAAMTARLDQLVDCTGIAGRDPAPPAGRAYCE
jgi:arylsulfatase A-like enzyme